MTGVCDQHRAQYVRLDKLIFYWQQLEMKTEPLRYNKDTTDKVPIQDIIRSLIVRYQVGCMLSGGLYAIMWAVCYQMGCPLSGGLYAIRWAVCYQVGCPLSGGLSANRWAVRYQVGCMLWWSKTTIGTTTVVLPVTYVSLWFELFKVYRGLCSGQYNLHVV